jgi:hypothetical protein
MKDEKSIQQVRHDPLTHLHSKEQKWNLLFSFCATFVSSNGEKLQQTETRETTTDRNKKRLSRI